MINNPKNLMMSISNCDEVERAKEDSNHPCYKIVHYQYIENQRKVFQHPEPWNGNIEKATVLFVGSNPSIDFDEDYPTDEWCDNDIYKFHYDRFSVSNDYY